MHNKLPMLQEEFQHDPWKMLIACMLLNQTSFKQVRKIIWDLFERYPTPHDMINADESILASMMNSLGFYNKRAKALKRMSKDYIDNKPINELFGIGKYAIDSYDIFILNKIKETKPTDKKLIAYKERMIQ